MKLTVSLMCSFLVVAADATVRGWTTHKQQKEQQQEQSSSSRNLETGKAKQACSGIPMFPVHGRDNSQRLLHRHGIIDEIPSTMCGNNQGKNVILIVGDGMGWEMVRAGAVAKRVTDELVKMGCDLKKGCADNQEAKDAFAGRSLADYYTEGKGNGLSFQELDGFDLVTTTTTVIQEPNPGNHYAPGNSLLKGSTREHKPGMAPLAVDGECDLPIDFSPLDYEADGGNMVLWDPVKGGALPWDPRYYEENPDTSDGFDPTYIMQHATDSASTAGTLATGHKSAVGMVSQDLYEEDVATLVEDAMYCDKAAGVVTSVTMLHATPGSFIAHSNNRRDTDTLQKSFKNVNPSVAAGVCNSGYYPKMWLDSMQSGPMSKEWTVLTQSPDVKKEDFYSGIGDLDPDNGDHLLICLGGDFSEADQSNMPYRGIDSSYSERWCSSGEAVTDDEGNVSGINATTKFCNHYDAEDVAQIPPMAETVKATLEFLAKDDDGFFMMYEQGDIDWAAHANHMDDMLGTMLDVDDGARVIMDWVSENGGWEKNALYVTADHDHFLTLNDNFPERLAMKIISGKSHNITPKRNSNVNPWSAAVSNGRHEEETKSQVEHIADFTTWDPADIDDVGHFWGPRGSGGNGWGSHSTRPVPLHYAGDDGCIEQLRGEGFRVLGRDVAGTEGMVDQMHVHACMMRSLMGLGKAPTHPPASVQLGPRPFYLVDKMKDSDLKATLSECAKSTTSYKTSDFSIGHRGGPLQFPEHTGVSYSAASRMGAGIVECDVVFTKEMELVCRHAQCDLHTTTDVVLRPEMNAKCTTPWQSGTSPKCCTSDFTLEELRTLCAKMDSSNDVEADTAEGYVFGGTADFRTDVYQAECEKILTHVESIELIHGNDGKFTPELKLPSVDMPYTYNGTTMTQDDLAAKLADEYKHMGIPASRVWPQSATLSDVKYWVSNTDLSQAVALDFEDDRTEHDAFLEAVAATGATYIAPPMWKLVKASNDGTIVASDFAEMIKEKAMNIITWTLDRTAGPLEDGETDYYWQTLQNQGLALNEGSRFELLDALYKDVGIVAIFDDWPAVATFYANCMGIALR